MQNKHTGHILLFSVSPPHCPKNNRSICINLQRWTLYSVQYSMSCFCLAQKPDIHMYTVASAAKVTDSIIMQLLLPWEVRFWCKYSDHVWNSVHSLTPVFYKYSDHVWDSVHSLTPVCYKYSDHVWDSAHSLTPVCYKYSDHVWDSVHSLHSGLLF